MKELPLLRLVKIQAAIAYLEFIKKSRQFCLHILAIVAAMFLMCVGIILVCLSFLIDINTGVLPFGAALIIIAAAAMCFLLAQKAWMRIFEVDKLIEDIAKGGEK